MRRKSFMIFFLLCAMTGVVNQVRAWVCCDPWGFVGQAAFLKAGAGEVGAVGSSATSLIGAMNLLWTELQNGFGLISGGITKQFAYQQTLMAGRLAVQTSMYAQQRYAESVENAVPAAQQDTTIVNAAMYAEQNNIVRQRLRQLDADFMGNFYAMKNMDESVVIERHKPYCSDQDVAMGRCQAAAADLLQNADISVNSVLMPGEGDYETLSDQEVAAAKAFVQNIVNPVPGKRPNPGALNAPQAKLLEAQLLTDQAALSISSHILNAEIGLRTRRNAS